MFLKFSIVLSERQPKLLKCSTNVILVFEFIWVKMLTHTHGNKKKIQCSMYELSYSRCFLLIIMWSS